MKLEDLSKELQGRIVVIHNNFERRTTRELRDIIVFKEKHGDRYFRFDTLAAVQATALSVLKDRVDVGYIYKPNPVDPIGFTEEDIKNYPDALKVEAYTKFRNYVRQKEWFDIVNEDYNLSKYALFNNDGKVAWNVIRNRQDYEYESYYLENFEKVCTLDQQH
jgi:hypothetical protein